MTQVTTLKEQVESACNAGDLITADMVERWPVWMALAREHGAGKLSSPYMLVATAMLSQAVMAMLGAQVSPEDVEGHIERLFDFYTDPELAAQIQALSDDKAEFLAFTTKLVAQQVAGLTAAKVKN